MFGEDSLSTVLSQWGNQGMEYLWLVAIIVVALAILIGLHKEKKNKGMRIEGQYFTEDEIEDL